MRIDPQEPTAPLWLLWASEIQAIGQTGLHFSLNEFEQPAAFD